MSPEFITCLDASYYLLTARNLNGTLKATNCKLYLYIASKRIRVEPQEDIPFSS